MGQNHADATLAEDWSRPMDLRNSGTPLGRGMRMSMLGGGEGIRTTPHERTIGVPLGQVEDIVTKMTGTSHNQSPNQGSAEPGWLRRSRPERGQVTDGASAPSPAHRRGGYGQVLLATPTRVPTGSTTTLIEGAMARKEERKALRPSAAQAGQ